MTYVGPRPANKVVTTADIADSAVTAAKIADGTVVAGELASDSVTTAKILNANVTTAKLAADAVDGTKIADDAVNSEHYTDGSIDTAHIADDQITLAKMASGTDGNIISYDASGNPVAIATGNDGQVLTSAGAGQPPAFEASAGFDVTSITGATALAVNPALTDEIVLSDAGTLKRLDVEYISNHPCFSIKGGALTVSANTHTKCVFSAVQWNVGSNFDASTNYRFTCPADKEGKYLFTWNWGFTDSMDANKVAYTRLRKNNVEHYWHVGKKNTAYENDPLMVNGCAIVDLNHNDYVEIWARHDDSNTVAHAQDYSIFSGFRLSGEM